MWNVIKAELKYKRIFFLQFSLIIITLQGIEVLQKVLKPEHVFINSDNIMFVVIFFFIISIYQKRMKENQIRFLSMLPLSCVNVALIRFWSGLIPLIIMLIYFIISHFLLLFIWDVSTTIPFIKVGIVLIILALIFSASDSWLSDSNSGIRKENMLFPIIMLLPLLLAVYYISQAFDKNTSAIIIKIFEITIFLIGAITMRTTIFSFPKRKSYLS